MKKKLGCVFVLFAAFVSLGLRLDRAFGEETGEPPQTSAYACSLYCVNNGEFLLAQNGAERLPMASTTKILTALLAFEAARENDVSVEITEDMYSEGSSMYLNAGESVKLSQLASAMLMVSGNDAANAIAITVGGSAEGFAGKMNDRARSLGLSDTHFVTPSGLDADGHYTTACDLAKLMASCMEDENFAKADRAASVTVDFTQPEGKRQIYYNENRLLSRYEYCIGGKTGYTDKAGRTLVSCAEKDGVRLVCVTLNDGDDWNDHIALYDYGFGIINIEKPEDGSKDLSKLTVAVVGGAGESVRIESSEPPLVCMGENTQTESHPELPAFVYAPVGAGQKLGEIKYYTGGVYAGKSDITAAENIDVSAAKTSFAENVVSFFRAAFRS